MPLYTAVIVDDEKLARESIKKLLQNESQWKIVAEAVDGNEAVRIINEYIPDLIFLDIDIPMMKGIDLIDRLVNKPNIVFTTAYDQFALRAFDKNAIDYLLKPYSDKRFYEALSRVETRLKEHQSSQKMEAIRELLGKKGSDTERPKKIPVHIRGGIELVDIKDILWVNASGNYVELFTSASKYIHYTSMNEMEKLLDELEFIRIHRSHIVRRDQIVSLKKRSGEDYFIVLRNGKELRLSRANRRAVKKIVGLI